MKLVEIEYLLDADVPRLLHTAVKRHAPAVGILRVQDVGLRTAEDPQILTFAAETNRIVVSRDRSTMTDAAAARIRRGDRMPGLLPVRRGYAVAGKGIGVLVRELELIASASKLEEWDNVVQFIPFLYA